MLDRLRAPLPRAAFLVVCAVLFLTVSSFVDELRTYQGAQVMIYLLAISSITLLTGYSGQISLGHGALMALGGYGAALSYSLWHWHLLFALLFGTAVGTLSGFLLGFAAARVSGPYLAGTTLALAVGLPTIADQFKVLGGEQGLNFDIGDAPSWLLKAEGEGFTQYKWFFWVAIAVVLPAMWAITNLLQSGYGREWRASRSNPTAASLSGVNVSKRKILAFTLSSTIASLSGALFGMLLGIVTPTAFPLALSFTIMTGAVLAGVSNLAGSIIGAVVLVAIPELSSSLASHLGGSERVTSNLPGLVTSLLLVVVVLFMPQGLIKGWPQKFNLRKKTFVSASKKLNK